MIANLFHVATEFKFEIGAALLASKQLQSSVGQISQAADGALSSMSALGLGMAAKLGIAEISILGIGKAAIDSADKFRLSQLAMANLLSSNKENLVGPIDTFNQRLQVSETILNRIGKAARDFALDETALMSFTKMTAAMLLPKGLAGANMGAAIDISRTLLKSAPTLGVQPWEVQNQLLEIIEGRAGGNNTLFRRLVSDTDVFKGITGSGKGNGGFGGQFNTLPAVKRVELLSKALNQFAKDTDVLSGNVNTMSGQFQRLSTLISGPISSIFRPLGDELLPVFVKILNNVGNVLDNQGRSMVKSFAKITRAIVENPENLAVNLMQTKRLQGDVAMAGKLGGFIGSVVGLQALVKFGSSLPVVGVAFRALGGTMGFVRSIVVNTARDIFLFFINPMKMGRALMAGLSFLPRVFSFFSMLAPVVIAVLKPFALLLSVFQIISRAIAIAHVNDAKQMLQIAPMVMGNLVKIFSSIRVILSPISDLFDFIARLIAPIFQVSVALGFANIGLEILAKSLRYLADAVSYLKGAVGGLFSMIWTFLDSVAHLQFGGLADRMAGSFMDTYLASMKRDQEQMNGEGAPVMNQTTNIGSVTIQNQFKEQLEPDRIAFSLVSQLKKVAANPTRGSRPASDFNMVDQTNGQAR